MKIAVLEDDLEFAQRLERLIRQFTHFPTDINTNSTDELARWIGQAMEPALYLLDIVLNDDTAGLQIAQQIFDQKRGGLIVFLTAYPHTIMSNPFFKTKAFNVILKNTGELEQEIKDTLCLAEQVLKEKCLYIHSGRFETLYILYDSICFIEAIKGTNKLCIHCTDGQYIIRGTLKDLLQKLNHSNFIRCHKSIIANKTNIRKRDASNLALTFCNGATCPYSYFMKGGLDSAE